jgi:hypothetical protein
VSVSEDKVNDWAHFIARSCAEGEALVKVMSLPENREFLSCQRKALMLLRRGNLEDGFELLIDSGGYLDLISGVLSHILNRHHLPVLAYYCYCKEDFGRAENLLDRALEHTRRAIDGQRFLLPLAESAIEFQTQRVRIAREERKWEEMRRRLDVLEGELRDQIPLFTLDDGTIIKVRELKSYYERLDLSDDERGRLVYILDDTYRSRTAERIRDKMFCLPGFVIGYP